MRLYRVADCNLSTVVNNHYDIAFFASGYEQRCTFIPEQLNKALISHPVVLGFKESRTAKQRKENDRYFLEHWTPDLPTIKSNDDGPIYEYLQPFTQSHLNPIKVLVDYSSMSRLWYTAVLNWARFASVPRSLEIDFVYSVGTHREPYPSMVINDILCIPGCEGSPVRLSKSIAIFGLGFEGFAALCVLDRLEPQEVYAYYAAPAAFEDYPQRTLSKNETLLQQTKHIYPLPLSSVERTYSALAEITSAYRTDSDITLIPMGPKPHVLSAILLSMRFKEIACLRVSGKGTKPEDVEATGETVVTRIQFRSEGGSSKRAV
jgi:hypothetical protein